MTELHDVAQAHKLMQERLAMPAGTAHAPARLVLQSPVVEGDRGQFEALHEQARKVNILITNAGESWGFMQTDAGRRVVEAMSSPNNTVSR